MNKTFIKKIIPITFTLIIIMCSFAYASVFTDIMNFFGNNASDFDNAHIEKSLYDTLDNDEKEVFDVINNIYIGISNLDVDSVVNYIDIKDYSSDVEYIKKVINENKFFSSSAKALIKGLHYKILAMEKEENAVIADIEYKCDGFIGLFIKDSGNCKFKFKKDNTDKWKLDLSDEIVSFVNAIWENMN